MILSANTSALLLVDIQERLMPAMGESAKVIWNSRRLIDGAQLFEVPIAVTEQYPQGLGPTVTLLKNVLATTTPYFEKTAFSAMEVPELVERLKPYQQIVLCGVEAHVCVLQTAFELTAHDHEVHLVVDAVASRFSQDYKMALQRMQSESVFLTTTESVLFQWCRNANHPHFKALSKLARETLN